MEIDKKNVLDQLYILKHSLMDESEKQNKISIDKSEDVCLKNLAIGRSDAFQKAWMSLDSVIRTIINI